MLQFFRKYQKYCFFFVAVVIIATFSFFGTFSTFDRDEKQEDRTIAKKIDGSPLLLSEVRELARWLATDQMDLPDHGKMPNFCNDGVIRKDLLKTGIAALLVEAYFDVFKEEIVAKVDRAKRFKGYFHPDFPILSAAVVWERFAPKLQEELIHLREETEVSRKTFSILANLYERQNDFPTPMLRQILFMEEKRLGLRRDPMLEQGDISFLGLHSLTDWFGHDFLNLSAEFVLNAAVFAEEKGYRVSIEEAKGDLLCNFETFIQKRGIDRSKLPTFHEHLRSFGFDETGAAKIWQKVLLFRRVFQGISASTFLDRLAFKEFAAFTHETAVLDRYRWPSVFRFKTFQDLIDFETYLSAIAPALEDPLGLPKAFYSLDEVKANTAELVQATYKAKVRELSLEETALRIPLKEIWSWQVEDQNWERLKRKFPILKESEMQRFQVFESMPSTERSEIEAFSRLCILQERHPEWIDEAISNKKPIEKTISVSQETSSLPHISKPWRFLALLKDAEEEKEGAKEALLHYLDDEKTVYRIEEIVPDKPLHILTFAEAKKEGVISKIVDRKLEAAYTKIRTKYPDIFQMKEGIFHPYSKVKEQIAEKVFSKIWQAVDQTPSQRFFALTNQALKDLKKNPNDPKWVSEEGNFDQFKLEKSEFLIARTSEEEWMKEKAFSLVPNEWSPIHVPTNGDISFFYLKEKRIEDPLLFPQISFGKELIYADAARYLAENLLTVIQRRQAIQIPIEGSE